MARRNRFVSADTVRLDLSDGDWIEVKAQLTYAETVELQAAGVANTLQNGELTMDWVRYAQARINAWLVDWSFEDAAEKRVPFTPQAVSTLDPDTAAEIDKALDVYLERQAEAKKATAGALLPASA